MEPVIIYPHIDSLPARYSLNPHAPNFFMNAQMSGVMAKSRGYQQAWLGGASKPSTFAWIVALFAIVVQQNRMSNALYDPLDSPAPALASLVAIVIASSFVYRDITKLLARNGVIIAYISLAVISAVWSMHPDITLRRGLGCILTILTAAYIAVQFDEKDRMKLFSFVCVIPAIVSLYTIMSGSCVELAECGRYQKGTLGELMAVGIFVELYLLVLGNWRPIWRFGLLSIYLTLLILSQSVTNWLMRHGLFSGNRNLCYRKARQTVGPNRCNHLCIAPALATTWLMVQCRLAAGCFR